jgi:hypothetical protein
MRTNAVNRFASSHLCRSLQDEGKTPLTPHRSDCPFLVVVERILGLFQQRKWQPFQADFQRPSL